MERETKQSLFRAGRKTKKAVDSSQRLTCSLPTRQRVGSWTGKGPIALNRKSNPLESSRKRTPPPSSAAPARASATSPSFLFPGAVARQPLACWESGDSAAAVVPLAANYQRCSNPAPPAPHTHTVFTFPSLHPLCLRPTLRHFGSSLFFSLSLSFLLRLLSSRARISMGRNVMRWIRERPKLGRGVRRKRRDYWAWGLHHNRGSAPTRRRQPLRIGAPKSPREKDGGGTYPDRSRWVAVSGGQRDGGLARRLSVFFEKASISLLCLPLNLFPPSSSELYYLIARFLQSGPCNKSAQVRGRRISWESWGMVPKGKSRQRGVRFCWGWGNGRPWLVLPSAAGFEVGREEWIDGLSCSSYPCFPFAQVLVQELEEHQVRNPFGKRWGGLGWVWRKGRTVRG